MRKILFISAMLLFLALMIIPMGVRADYIENITIPSKVKEGDTFIVSFDASYIVSGEVYVKIGLCDEDNVQIKDDDGYAIGVHLKEDKFIISEEPIRRNVDCVIRDQPEGTYKVGIVIYDASTNERLWGVQAYSDTFELTKDSKSGSDDSCSDIYLIIIPTIIGVTIVLKRYF